MHRNPQKYRENLSHVRPFYSAQKVGEQAEMLARRVKKSFRRYGRDFAQRKIEAFRLYDHDIPEIRAVVDWYKGNIVVSEYVRTQTQNTTWLESMARAVGETLKIPSANIFLRRRRTRPVSGRRYERQGDRQVVETICEGEFKFRINLSDFLDTGLFADHRQTRRIISSETSGKDFLNLFSYTGSFSVAAGIGGAASTTSVDVSRRYLDWSKENMLLNGLDPGKHTHTESDGLDFLTSCRRKWDLIFLDPPSFSDRGRDWDVQRDHPELISAAVKCLNSSGKIYFSTNHQRFVPNFDLIDHCQIDEISEKTIPVDFRRRSPHRCFRLQKRS